IDPENDRLSYGHVMLLDIPRLILPAGLGTVLGSGTTVFDGTPLRLGLRQARADGATIVWCHGLMGTEAVPNWVDGLIHAQNIYDGGNVGSIAEVYYPYLNAGLKIPFSTGTDWGIWDFSRVYVPIEGKVTSQRFLKQLTQGNSFITNGVFLDLQVDGRRPGDTVDLVEPGAVQVRARAIGRSDFVSLQLIFNGKVIHEVPRRPAEGHFIADINESVDLAEPGWLALRIPTQRDYHLRSRFAGVSTNILGKTLFAHTSPVYVTVGGERVFQPAAAKQLIGNLQQSIEQIGTQGAFQTSQSRRSVLKIYEEAVQILVQRLDRRANSAEKAFIQPEHSRLKRQQ
ncbi:MAG: CehA/McbA family metallohydrolase, partial [Bythopirellula sp.]